MVVLATGVTVTRRVLAMLADTAVAGTDVSSLLAIGSKPGRHHCYPAPAAASSTVT
jgi:hypothetical protein